MYLIAWIVGFVMCILAIILLPVLHKKEGPKILSVLLFALGFVTFMGSAFLHWSSENVNQLERKPVGNQQKVEPKDAKDDAEDIADAPVFNDVATNEPTTEPTSTPDEPEKNVELDLTPTSNSSGAIGDHYVEIKDAVIVDDKDGNPAIVITYAWTNNSDETTRSDLAIREKAFQDGIQMDTAIIGDKSIYDPLSSTKEIRPGATIDVQNAYAMKSYSIVEFELEDVFGRLDDIITENFDPTKLG